MSRPALASAVAVLAAGLAGAGVAHSAGAVAVSTAVAGLALLAARLTLPGPPRPTVPPRRIAVGDEAAFPTYRRIRADLMWAASSGRSYDATVRPLLARLARAALADRHRVDLDADPAAARELIGADIWPLVDPTARLPASRDRLGVDGDSIAEAVDRLERL